MQTHPDISFAIGEQRDHAVLSKALRFPTMILITDEHPVVPVETKQPIAGALVEYFRCIAGEHPDWDEYRQAMRRQGKSLIRITIDGWGPIATGGFPPDRTPQG